MLNRELDDSDGFCDFRGIVYSTQSRVLLVRFNCCVDCGFFRHNQSLSGLEGVSQKARVYSPGLRRYGVEGAGVGGQVSCSSLIHFLAVGKDTPK